MTIEITHYAADRDFYVQDDISDSEYSEYVTAYADAVRQAVEADYPEATVETEINWYEASMNSMSVFVNDEDDDLVWQVGESVRMTAERIWNRQAFEPAA